MIVGGTFECRLRKRDPFVVRGKPGEECEAASFAFAQHRLVGACRDVVAVLHRDDLGYVERRVELLDVHIADADAADLASLTEIYERAERLLGRNVWFDRVELIQIDPLETEPPQAAVACPH